MAALKLTEVKGNLFHMPQTYSLAHAVSADLDTVKGSIAWQFTVIFGQVDELNKQQISSGNMALLEHNSRFIYFLITKDTLYGKTTYATLRLALICMREHMRNHGVTKVAMPRICCGSDGLHWQTIKEMILQIFCNEYNVEIIICEHKPQITSKCQISEIKANLFSAPADYSLVHSVSADFAMSKGIGLLFKYKFGQVNELMKQNKHTGSVAVLRDNDRFIYNLVTKERNHEKCTYSALFYAAMAMREHMILHKVTKLAIPRIGCGIDRLSWIKVKKILELVFAEDNVDILVYFRTEPSVERVISRMHGIRLQPVE